jgi:hypothetical protein
MFKCLQIQGVDTGRTFKEVALCRFEYLDSISSDDKMTDEFYGISKEEIFAGVYRKYLR